MVVAALGVLWALEAASTAALASDAVQMAVASRRQGLGRLTVVDSDRTDSEQSVSARALDLLVQMTVESRQSCFE